ncbi:unnamed protein product, partial [Didymodactylos carnosus]
SIRTLNNDQTNTIYSPLNDLLHEDENKTDQVVPKHYLKRKLKITTTYNKRKYTQCSRNPYTLPSSTKINFSSSKYHIILNNRSIDNDDDHIVPDQ